MGKINVVADDLEFDDPLLVEGLPGIGLVGKIVADHLVETFDMTRYANVHCDGLPPAVTYGEDDPELVSPVRLYADEERDLLVLQSDVPVSPKAATEFAGCVSGWFAEEAVTPIYLSGIPREKDPEPPSMYGLSVGSGSQFLEDAGIGNPAEPGIVSGPTGALLAHAVEMETTAVGLVVESDSKFPDPEAARILIAEGIEPITGIDIPVEDLVERATEIQEAKEQLARRMQEADEESTQAMPLRMYQ